MAVDDERHWTQSRNAQLGVILALIAQAATLIWFASEFRTTTNARLSVLENHYAELAKTTASNREFQVTQRVRLWDRVNEQGEKLNLFAAEMAGINARLEYITRTLDRLVVLSRPNSGAGKD